MYCGLPLQPQMSCQSRVASYLKLFCPHQASFATALSSGYLGDEALFVTQKQFCDSFGVSEGVCDRREIL